MRLSVSFSGFGGLADTIPVVEAAERFGLDGVWTAEHLGFHDAVVPSSVYLAKTERIEIGLVGLSTASRHPGLTAMELMSMSELAPGRIRAQVGLGDDSLVAKLGRSISKPIASTTAFVNSLREAMQGRDMKVSYPEFVFDGFRLAPLGPVPAIDVMAIRPKMVQVAARVGDGLSISIGASAQYLRDVVADVERELAEAGRDRSSFRITALAMTAIGPDLDMLRAPIAPMLSTFPQASAAFLARGVIDADELVRVEREEGPFGVMKMWTPDRVDQIAFIATPDMLADRLAEYAATGIDELSLMMINPPDQQPAIIEAIAAARPS
ncbi:MAG: LLM class flavin-dependent oxidoreductase [Ilumatobacteraceae bacterium]